jgi:hypothetical protein
MPEKENIRREHENILLNQAKKVKNRLHGEKTKKVTKRKKN